jgi:virginiamycin B lyase
VAVAAATSAALVVGAVLAAGPATAAPGIAQPGSEGAAAAAAEPWATDAPGMKTGTGTLPGTGPIHEFAPFPTPAGFSCEVAIANNGNLISDEFVGNAMGVVDPHTGAVHDIPLPNPGGLPGGQNRGPDGNIWFMEVGGNAIGELDPETEEITTHAFPWLNVNVPTGPLPLEINNGPGVPFDNTWGKDDKLYFTAIGLNSIGSFDPVSQEWELFPIPSPVAGPVAMEEGPGETIAITEGLANKVALFDVDTHRWREYAIPTPGVTFPAGLTVSPDDRYLYFGETLASKIGRLDSVTGEIYEYDLLALRDGLLGGSLPGGNPLPQPGQLRFGSDGKLYFVQGTFTGGSRIGQLDVETSEYHELETPTPLSMPCDLNNTVPGKMVFASFASNRVAYFDIPNTTDISNTYPRFG